MNHNLTVYVNHETRLFSVTARAADCNNWDRLDRHELCYQRKRIDVATGLTKQQADEGKAELLEMFERLGYSKAQVPAVAAKGFGEELARLEAATYQAV